MRTITNAEVGHVCMDERARYNNSIRGHEMEKRHLRMTDKEEEAYQKARKEYRQKLAAQQRKPL